MLTYNTPRNGELNFTNPILSCEPGGEGFSTFAEGTKLIKAMKEVSADISKSQKSPFLYVITMHVTQLRIV